MADLAVKSIKEKLDYYFNKGIGEVELECRENVVYNTVRKMETLDGWKIKDLGRNTVRFEYLRY